MALGLRDYMVLGIIGVWLFLVIKTMIRRHKRGQCISCGACSLCQRESTCSKEKRSHKRSVN